MKITREREEKLIVSAWYEMVSFSALTKFYAQFSPLWGSVLRFSAKELFCSLGKVLF